MYLPVVVVFLAACAAAGATGVIFKPGAWYRGLNKPSWTPPNWAFPVAWTILYILIALAAARVSLLPGNAMALAFWSLQIVLNTLWTPVFFGAHRMKGGLCVIVLLWIAILGTLVAFWQLDPLGGLMIVPYFLWVSYATALNFSVWRLNPKVSGTPAA